MSTNDRPELSEIIATRFSATLARAHVRDLDTGGTKPLTIPMLAGYLSDEFAGTSVPISESHLYRISRGTTDVQLDTLWVLAKTFGVHPAYFLGVDDQPTPARWPAHAPAPSPLTRKFSRKLKALRGPADHTPGLTPYALKQLRAARAVPKLSHIGAIAAHCAIEPMNLL